MIYFCCEEGRRSAVRAHQTLQGIDHLEVADTEFKDPDLKPLRQQILRVFFVEKHADSGGAALRGLLAEITPAHVRITGGDAVHGITVNNVKVLPLPPSDSVDPAGALPRLHLELEVDRRGDYSTYTLYLVEPETGLPMGGLDSRLASIDFSFKVECASDFDCAPTCDCPPATVSAPDLDYLAKDYASFRQLMLDRMALLLPDWRERNPADLGITLVELLAYVGDYLSYRQDAIATEAYLGTARQRVSVRRHARLLDYRVHEGNNARVWIQVRLKSTSETIAGVRLHRILRPGASGLVPAGPDETLVPGANQSLRVTRFTTAAGGATCLPAEPHELERLLAHATPEVFEPLEDVDLFAAHNEMRFYTWSDAHCCLPRGATKATLAGQYPMLQPGMVLILAEVLGPHTGAPADADPHKRHPVRLTLVRATDPAQADEPRRDPLTEARITEIEWASEDALPFALCVSSVAESGPATGRHLPDVSVAWGNLVLADHGCTILQPEKLPAVPSPNPALAPVLPHACGPCGEPEDRGAPVRFSPRLANSGLTFAEPFLKERQATSGGSGASAGSYQPAVSAFVLDARRARPALVLGAKHLRWDPMPDLLGSEAFDRHFVAEIESDGRAALRFGDDRNGQQPSPGAEFHALYRLGNGAAGNVGANAINRISVAALFSPGNVDLGEPAGLIEQVTNPLPARGGTKPETIEEVRQYAPQAFRVARRCVTPADYAARAAQHPEVQRAAATVRWTGSWPTIFLTVDRQGAKPVDHAFEDRLYRWLEPFRLAGHDLEIDAPRFVSLELQLFVCVAEGYFRSDVARALLEVFSTRQRPDGSRGFFHPDEWTFGQSLWLSQIYAAAQAVSGVCWLEVRVLRRLGSNTRTVPEEMTFGRTEIARLENDPNFPDHGRFSIVAGGGR